MATAVDTLILLLAALGLLGFLSTLFVCVWVWAAGSRRKPEPRPVVVRLSGELLTDEVGRPAALVVFVNGEPQGLLPISGSSE